MQQAPKKRAHLAEAQSGHPSRLEQDPVEESKAHMLIERIDTSDRQKPLHSAPLDAPDGPAVANHPLSGAPPAEVGMVTRTPGQAALALDFESYTKMEIVGA